MTEIQMYNSDSYNSWRHAKKHGAIYSVTIRSKTPIKELLSIAECTCECLGKDMIAKVIDRLDGSRVLVERAISWQDTGWRKS